MELTSAEIKGDHHHPVIKVIITFFGRIIDNVRMFVELPTERPGGS